MISMAKTNFNESALSAAEEAFAKAAYLWDKIDWSKKTAREAGIERARLFRFYMTIQKLAMSPGGPSPSDTWVLEPGSYLHGFWSQYAMRARDPGFMATGATSDVKGSPAAKHQATLARARKRELGRNPQRRESGGSPRVSQSARNVALKARVDALVGNRKK